MSDLSSSPAASDELRDFFDAFASVRARGKRPEYQRQVQSLYQFYVPAGSRILEIGCGVGDLLAGLQPSYGVGVDFSGEMVRVAKERFPQPHLHFVHQRAETLELDEQPFDYIVISDTLTFLDDILAVLRRIRPLCHSRTRIIYNCFSRLWQPILAILDRVGLRHRQPLRNWVTQGDMANLLRLAGLEIVTTDSRILVPTQIPLFTSFWNRWLGPLPLFRHLALTNWGVARVPHSLPMDTGTSVICPCRNETGNIRPIVERLPEFTGAVELIFVEGHSQDDTLQECYRIRDEYSHRDISVYQQTGKGKGDAVRLGFQHAKYPILMILDADMTVRPEDLPGFAQVMLDGSAEMVNGTRLVYAMESGAMRFLNLIANKFFAVAFSFLLGQPIKDTLCGTKVLLKSDYERLAAQRAYFGQMDPFGDFDLIFGSAKLALQIRDYPIRYQARTFGTTQIQRFRHGWLLLKMYGVGLLKFKWR